MTLYKDRDLARRAGDLPIAAAEALGALGDPRGVDYLVANVDNEWQPVAAASALSRLTGRKFPPNGGWKKWWQKERGRFQPDRGTRAACTTENR